MARLIASTLVLAGAALATAGSPPVEQRPVRQVAPRQEAAWNHHGVKALASLFAADADFISIAVAQIRMDTSADASPSSALRSLRSGWISRVAMRQSAPWLVASAHDTNLLANPPPR